MKVSKEKMAENRALILEAASQLFREKGIEAVSVSEVMKTVGLTHGGFYGHFKSKDDLIAQSIAHALQEKNLNYADTTALLADYLSRKHRDQWQESCPTARFVSGICQQSTSARQLLTEGIKNQIASIHELLATENPNTEQRQAIGFFPAMIGALILARGIDDVAFSDQILSQTQEWLKERAK